MTANLPLLLGIAAATLLLAALAVRLSSRVGLPSLLVYLAIGLLLGESGLGIDFDDTDLTQVLGLTALVVILAEGGLSTRWSVVRPGLNLALALSTVAVAVSIAVWPGPPCTCSSAWSGRPPCCGAPSFPQLTPLRCSVCSAASRSRLVLPGPSRWNLA